MSNPFSQNLIEFDPIKHIYSIKETGEQLLSVTKLIHNYCEPFDKNGHILRACAKRDGITPQELQLQWNKKRDESCLRGNSWHKQIEHFLLTKKILNAPDKDIVKKVKKNIKFEGQVWAEVLIYNLDFKICGTADIIEFLPETNEIICKDWKTNQEIKRHGYKGKKMLYPLNHLDDCSLSIYEMQLSTYSFFLECQGFKVKEQLELFWVNPEIRDIERISIPYRKLDVISMLNHYKNGPEFF